jgi:putative Mn2+ efflux pump MntP
LSWQTLLAAIGAAAGNRLGRPARTIAVIVGNLVIVGFAIFILFR